ncbi:hypothetical protein BLNAU_17983 [Blattamonas nauphoetae]|uniref:Uncharacterized protein n=1 Tax=Blattamonas nauphoetae TaxID=2049346 RepID=A0ABQ9X5M5_9EUKA|nr:hypothetical protein BLNAU_17983 [Blattamonas nauphoetae]
MTKSPVESLAITATCVPPVFTRTDPSTIRTVDQASPLFISLVEFVKAGNTLDDASTSNACAVLRSMISDSLSPLSDKPVLFDLVPQSPRSCSGFAESMIVLLTCPSTNLVLSSLSLLREVVRCHYSDDCLSLIETGFFARLPQSFFLQNLHLMAQPRLFAVDVVYRCAMCLLPINVQFITRTRNLSIASVRRITFQKLVQPLQPFLEYVCSNRHTIGDCEDSRPFMKLLGIKIRVAHCFEAMTAFVLSSSVPVAFADTFVNCRSEQAFTLLLNLFESVEEWKNEDAAVQKRGERILTRLCEEGVWDDVEVHTTARGRQEGAGDITFF